MHDVVWHGNNLISYISDFTCRSSLGWASHFRLFSLVMHTHHAPARTSHKARGITRPMVEARWFRRGRERCRVRIISPCKAPRPHSADDEKGTGAISWTRGERQRQDNTRQGGKRHPRDRLQVGVRLQSRWPLRSPGKRRQI